MEELKIKLAEAKLELKNKEETNQSRQIPETPRTVGLQSKKTMNLGASKLVSKKSVRDLNRSVRGSVEKE